MENIVVKKKFIERSVLEHEKSIERRASLVHVPKDKYFLGHIVFFLLGLCNSLPTIFYTACNNFWMYKFRNSTIAGITDASERTILQAQFSSSFQIVNSVPCVIFSIVNFFLAKKYMVMTRVNVSQGIQTIIFILFIAVPIINTDNYQIELFTVTLLGFFILLSANTVNSISVMNLFTRFPHEYMKITLVGQGAAGICADLINIMLMASFPNRVTHATLVYFIIGAFLITLTFLLTFVISKSEFFLYCMKSVPEQDEKLPSRRELIDISTKLQFVIIIVFIYYLNLSMTHTSVTALVVSEKDGDGSPWAKNYFSIVMTFLLADCGIMVGTLLSSYVPIKVPTKVFTIFTIVSSIAMVPMLWLCNAQPRSRLPVYFTRDYQYGIILGFYTIIMGYMLNHVTLYIPQKLDPKETDVGYNVFNLVVNVLTSVLSPLGMAIVNFL